MLSKSNAPKKARFEEPVSNAKKPGEEIVQIHEKSNGKVNPTKRMTQQDINQRLNVILSDD